MTAMQLADHPAGLQLQRGKQGSGAIPFVVVRAALHLARLQRQQRLRAVQRLNLALLIHAEHQGVIGRVHIQAHDVAHLFDQLRVRRQLEGIGAMRLQSEGMPDPADGHPAQSGGLGQSARGPVRLPARRAFQGLNDDLLDLGIAHLARRAGSRFVVESFQAGFQKARAPLAHHAHRAAQLPRHRLIVQSLGAGQHHPCSSRQQRLAPRPMRQRLQPLTLFVGQ